MKKIFTLLTLLLATVGGATSAWADDVLMVSWTTAPTTSNDNTGLSTTGTAKNVATWTDGTSIKIMRGDKGQGNGSNITINGTSYKTIKGSNGAQNQLTMPSGKYAYAVDIYGYVNKSSSEIGTTQCYWKEVNGTNYTEPKWTCYSDDLSTPAHSTYTLGGVSSFTFNNAGTQMCYVLAISTTPFTSQPTSASYLQNAVPSALTVTTNSTAGTPTYQWYSCTNANKAGEVAIDGATSASFDGISTLTEGTFYYFCKLTDNNGTFSSNVATITVSAAAAPTINISGTPAEPVNVGTLVTMTAALTGSPAPTIQWYSNTTASNTAGTEIDGATSETYSPSTAATGTFYFYAVATNSQGSATSDVQTLTVKEQLAAPTVTGSIAFVSSIDIDITDNSGKSATIKYSTDGGSVWNDYTTLSITADDETTVMAKVVKDGYIDSDVITTKYKKVASLHSATTVSEYTVWDWTKATTQVNLSATTIPSNDAVNVNAADFDGTIYSNVGWKTGFNAQALVMSKFQRPFDSSNNAFQGTSLKFTTTVPGAVKVEFCNTGSSTRPYRYLYVNGVATSYKSNNATKVTTDFIPVAAGEVELKGVIKAGEGAEADTDNYLRIFKVTFAPTETATITDADYATYVPSFKVAVPDGVKAYIVTAANSTTATLSDEGAITVIDKDVPVIIYKDVDANTDVTFTATNAAASSTTGNQLQTGAVASADGSQYILANGASGVGFYKATAGTAIAAGKAYLVSPSDAPFFLIDFGGNVTGIDAVKGAEPKVNGEVYDLQGRKVANPTKGLYIVNGRKVVIK